MRRKDVILTVLMVVFLGLAVKGFSARDTGHYKEFQTLAVIVEKILEHYVEEVDEKDIMEGALRGALRSLDPYSAYIPPEDFADFQSQTEGKFQGLGIEIGVRHGWLTVIAPIEDTPASRAGIRAGDQIRKIEGKSTENMSTMDAVKVLRGKKGTKVTITVVHQGESKPVDMTITRDVIPLISVRGYRRSNGNGEWDYMVDEENKIGYIRLTAFQKNTLADLDKAYHELEKKGMKGLVLDLRFNPGGLLSTAIQVSDRFIDKGVIVSTRGRTVKSVTYQANQSKSYKPVPLVILINNWSASASEIVAGAVQDHHRGVIVGEKSFGKGSVQNIIRLQGGKAALKLTTARYYTPLGRSIHREEGSDKGGLIPNIVLETTWKDEVKLRRWFMKLGTPQVEEKTEEKEKTGDDVPEAKDSEKKDAEEDDDLKDFEDLQLKKALDALKVLIFTEGVEKAERHLLNIGGGSA